MSTNFPTALDTYITLVDNVDAIIASHINNPRNAIEAIEAKIGADSSGVVTTIDYKIRYHNHQSTSQGGAVDLTSDAVTGILPKTSGGTGVTNLKISANGYAVYKA